MILFVGMQDHTAESIKSLENCRLAWVEEAQTLSTHSLALLRPTIRAEGSEIWFSWNPRRKSDAVDPFLRGERPNNAIVVAADRLPPLFTLVQTPEAEGLLLGTKEWEIIVSCLRGFSVN